MLLEAEVCDWCRTRVRGESAVRVGALASCRARQERSAALEGAIDVVGQRLGGCVGRVAAGIAIAGQQLDGGRSAGRAGSSNVPTLQGMAVQLRGRVLGPRMTVRLQHDSWHSIVPIAFFATSGPGSAQPMTPLRTSADVLDRGTHPWTSRPGAPYSRLRSNYCMPFIEP